MFGLHVNVIDETKRVGDAAARATYRNLGHAAASIRKDAQASITKSAEASPPGEPPHTRRGQARRAILFAVERDKQSAVVGFAESRIGEAMSAHEHGGEYKGTEFPQRPTMGPALERNLDRFAADWAGSIQ